MTRVLLNACFGVLVVIGVLSRPSETPCGPLQISSDSKVTPIFGGSAVRITCGGTDREKIAFCIDGRWSPPNASCSGDGTGNQAETEPKQDRELPKLNLNQDYLKLRPKRNTGKYPELRRRVKVQRKIRAGLLETRIDTTFPGIFRAHPFGNVYLACRIENLGAHSVTWIRLKDTSVLAIDTSALNGDRRLFPTYEEKTETWLLGIQGVRENDAGRYECQVSTKIPLRRIVTLQVFPADQPLEGPLQSDDHDLDFVLRNLTALWKEVHEVREEIHHHLHDDHHEESHDQVLKEVETLHHEHHVHHLHHPHPGHNEHHDAELLQHLEQVHGHLDDHSDGQPVHGHLHGHGHSHDHHHGKKDEDHEHEDDEDHDHEDGEDHDHEDGEDHDHEDGDDHVDHDHDHDDDHSAEHEGEHDDHDHGHDHEDDSGHHHHEEEEHEHGDAHDAHGLHSHEDEHEYGHEHEHHHVSEHHHDDHHDHKVQVVQSGPAVIAGRPRPGGSHKSDPWMHASCTLKPNVDDPNSNVKGSIIISQRKDTKGPVYFDLHITDMDVAATGKTHGFHVHESPVTDGSCASTGGHFNPDQVVHGAPEAEVRHVGDLGNIEVGDDGELHGYIIADDKVSFNGPNSILRRSIVVHAGVDDLGEGGDAGSLATGNAGGRLACCNVTAQTYGKLVNFRFKG